MKCIKRSDGSTYPIRVKDSVASDKVRSGEYVYCPKSKWKDALRPKSEVLDK